MTGTAREVRAELWSVYKLAVAILHIAPRNGGSRTIAFATKAAKWDAVTARAAEIHATGRPLIGTIGQTSEHLGALFERAGLPHAVERAAGRARPRSFPRRPARTHHGGDQHGRPRHRHRAGAGVQSWVVFT